MSKGEWADEAFGALVSMAPVVGPLLEGPAARMLQSARAEQARGRSVALNAACAVAGLSREDLTERIAADPRLVPLTTRVLFAAGMTGQDEILSALGAALGAAVHQPDDSDEADLILIGLQDIRRHHIEALMVLRGPARFLDVDSNDQLDVQAELAGWNAEGVAVSLGIESDAAYARLTALSRAGFARGRPQFPSEGYRITDLGITLCDVIELYESSR